MAMALAEIQLKRKWSILGPFQGDNAGYARLFEVEDSQGQSAIAKAVSRDPGADRELLFGDTLQSGQLSHCIPVLDYGEHEEFLVIIMPKADYSLAQYLKRQQSPLELQEAIQILRDIAEALMEIEGKVIHRDLKPANILLHEGRWVLSDFGVSRYADASTGTETRKPYFTARYAAPEQWEHRTATHSTDIYAFGIIAFELLTGKHPFAASNEMEFREAHLKQTPPEAKGAPLRIRMLIEQCLYKDPGTRPHARSVTAQLNNYEDPPAQSAGLAKLEAVTHEHTREQARIQVARNIEEERQEDLRRKFDAATKMLSPVVDMLQTKILEAAPHTVFEVCSGNAAPLFRARLGKGALEMTYLQKIESWRGPFSVVAACSISATSYKEAGLGYARSHSLWFCDAQDKGRFAWSELAFMDFALTTSRTNEPYSLSPYDVNTAFNHVIGSEELAWPVTELNSGTSDEFIDRWLGWFAEAASGELRRPSGMPERSVIGSWRSK